MVVATAVGFCSRFIGFTKISHENVSGKRAASGGARLNVSGLAKEEKGRFIIGVWQQESGNGPRRARERCSCAAYPTKPLMLIPMESIYGLRAVLRGCSEHGCSAVALIGFTFQAITVGTVMLRA